MSEKYIIDRVEGNQVIVEKENGDMYKISIANIWGDFVQGDILVDKGEHFEIDKNFTKKRRNQVDRNMKDMWEE